MLQNKRIGIVLITIVVFLGACTPKQAVEQTIVKQDTIIQESADFKTISVVRGTYTNTEEFQGTVIFFQTTSLKFSENEVAFKQFLIEEGSFVTKGNVLAEGIKNISKAEKEAILLQLDSITGELEREAKLYQEEQDKLIAISRKAGEKQHLYELQIEKMKLEYEHYQKDAQSEIKELQQQIEAIDHDISTITISAPFDGIVDKLAYISEDDMVLEDRWMIQMHSEDQSFIQITDSKELLAFQQEVLVEAGGSNRVSYSGKVVQADNLLSNTLKTGKAYIKLDDESVNLDELTNIVVKAVTKTAENVLMIDREALYTEKGKKYVVLYEDGIMKKRYVTIGLNNSSTVCIIDGIYEGQKVIVE